MAKGQVFALLGQNGAGKTTLVNILAGNMLPTHGDAYVFGESVKTVRGARGCCIFVLVRVDGCVGDFCFAYCLACMLPILLCMRV